MRIDVSTPKSGMSSCNEAWAWGMSGRGGISGARRSSRVEISVGISARLWDDSEDGADGDEQRRELRGAPAEAVAAEQGDDVVHDGQQE